VAQLSAGIDAAIEGAILGAEFKPEREPGRSPVPSGESPARDRSIWRGWRRAKTQNQVEEDH
jgi:hypothetical protein